MSRPTRDAAAYHDRSAVSVGEEEHEEDGPAQDFDLGGRFHYCLLGPYALWRVLNGVFQNTRAAGRSASEEKSKKLRTRLKINYS
jgi:hypothetical protein